MGLILLESPAVRREKAVQILFNDYALDVDRRELKRGSELVALEPQVFDLLVYLAQNSHRVVSKDDVMAAVWGGRIVSESTLTSRINAARKAVGDSGEWQRVIRTIPRKGFRFVGELKHGPPALDGQDNPIIAPKQPAGAAPEAVSRGPTSPLPLADRASIAVLPFNNLSEESGQDYFSKGITEDLITALSNVRSFFVIDRSSSFIFEGPSVDIKEVGQRLGVRYVLVGSIRKSQDKVRVSAQLIEAGTGSHVWANRYDSDLHDVFDVQDKIVASVVGALEPQLLRAEVERIHRKRPENFDAYDLTLCGLSYMNKLNPEATRTALGYFRKAIDADSTYARAYCCASWCYRRQVQLRGMILSEADMAESIRLAKTAIQIDNTDPYVLWQVGMTVGLVEQDIVSALSLIDRSLAANANSNRAWLASASIRCFSGEPQTVIENAERAVQLSPLDTSMWVAYGVLAVAHVQLAGYEEAEAWARRSVQLHREHVLPRLALVASLSCMDQGQQAEFALAELLKLEPDITLAIVQKRFPLNRFQNLERFLNGLSKAGLPA
jgi:TolB-like protein/Tfp pilus assembly protein PilF